VEYKKGEYVWVRNFNKGPKQKIQPRFMTEPFEVVKDYGHAVLLRNYLGIVTQMHKNNVKHYHPRNLEMYNALPFKVRLKLGSHFNSKELHKFFDELNAQEDEAVVKEKEEDNKPEIDLIKDFEMVDDESEEDSETEEVVDKTPKGGKQIEHINTTNPREPDLPFHMKLRKKKVKFSK
jgi:hypothetical protein